MKDKSVYLLLVIVCLGLSSCVRHLSPRLIPTPVAIVGANSPLPTLTLPPSVLPATLTPTLTLQATFTPEPLEGDLSAQIGFMDVDIEQILAKDTECNLTGRSKHSHQDSLYTAYLVACRSFRYLLVYRQGIQGGEAPPELALSFSDVAICFDCALSGENWQDVDGDGRPDLVIGRGNNYIFANRVYRMTEDGAFQDLLEACPFSQTGMINPSFQDLGEDGAWELVAIDARWDYDQTDFFYVPAISRLYTLQACEYQDVSAAHPQFYQHTIDVFQRNYEYLRSGGVNRDVTVFSAIEGLLACDAVGRRDTCWETFWEMTDLEKYPLAVFQGPDPTPDAATLEFVRWVEALRILLKEQYEAGLPFSPG